MSTGLGVPRKSPTPELSVFELGLYEQFILSRKTRSTGDGISLNPPVSVRHVLRAADSLRVCQL